MTQIEPIKCNYLICKNRVVVEGEDIGGFSGFSTTDNRQTILGSAEVVLPLYTIVNDGSAKAIGISTKSYQRIDPVKYKLIMGAKIQVYISYLVGVGDYQLPEILAFDGYIKQVVNGFPTKIICEDGGFPLRFGTLNDKSWTNPTDTKKAFTEMLPVSNAAFKKYRDESGLSYAIEPLQIDDNCFSTDFLFKAWKGISPYFAIEYIMNMYKLYAKVRKGKFWAGLGISESENNTIKLSTKYNVIARDLSLSNAFFDKYEVEVNFIANGKVQQAKAGAENGERITFFRKVSTPQEAQSIAERSLKGLQGDNCKGSITTLPYPEVDIFDWVDYEDSLFPELSSMYYVIEKKLQCSGNGYRQTLSVVNKTLAF